MASKTISTLTTLRRRCSISQEELADAIGRSQPDISMYENGLAMRDDTAEAILRILREKDPTIDPSLTAGDLQRPWEEVHLRLVG